MFCRVHIEIFLRYKRFRILVPGCWGIRKSPSVYKSFYPNKSGVKLGQSTGGVSVRSDVQWSVKLTSLVSPLNFTWILHGCFKRLFYLLLVRQQSVGFSSDELCLFVYLWPRRLSSCIRLSLYFVRLFFAFCLNVLLIYRISRLRSLRRTWWWMVNVGH